MENLKNSDAYRLAEYIKNSEKKTPVKAYINGDIKDLSFNSDKIQLFGNIVIGDIIDVKNFLKENKKKISNYFLEYDRRNSAIPLLDITDINARIEPGAFIREQVKIEKNAVIMMGAIINIGAVIGEESMIDMGVILGARSIVGKRVHIGAGTVLAGVLEPPSANPVTIEDDVFIGANCVVIEGIRIKKDSVVAAGSIVTRDVPENVVVAGAPAKIIKIKDKKTLSKTKIIEGLRK